MAYDHMYRIMSDLKIETDIICLRDNIPSRLIGRAVIAMIMYVETFETDVIALLVLNVLDDLYFPVS
jgi:hypothetical protein